MILEGIRIRNLAKKKGAHFLKAFYKKNEGVKKEKLGQIQKIRGLLS